MRFASLFAALLFSCFLQGQVPALSIEKIMEGERFVGFLPENPFWSEDGQFIYFSWNPGMDTLRSLFKVSLRGGAPEPVSPEEQRFLSGGGEYSPGRNWKVFEKYGDIFLLGCKQSKTLRLTNTSDSERRPVFCGSESTIVYQRGHNLFAWDKATGATTQLTPFQTGNPNISPRKGEAEAWLEKDQLAYFEVLRKRKALEEARERQGDAIELATPKTIYLENRNLQTWQVSPDLRHVVCRLQSNGNANSTKVPVFVTESGYVEFPNARSKVGAAQDRFQTFVYDRIRDTCYALRLDSLPGIFDKPAFLREYHRDSVPFAAHYDLARPTIVHGPYFSENGLAVAEVKALDNKDRWIVLIDLSTGNATCLDRQHDDAWIGGPGISGWNFSAGKLDWADDRHIFFHSEETGFSHLYLLDVHTGEKKALTSGPFEIIHADLSADKKFFYITSNKESPHERHFYRLPVRGGKMEKLTGGPGNYQVTLSPDEKNMAVLYSYSNRPWELFVQPAQAGAPMRQLTASTTDAFRAYPWRDPEIVYFPARDGARVPARLYRPENAVAGGPAVIFVHGAGYLQNVHRWWSTYFREFMFHNFLADKGYTVLDIDFRASEGYGRDWRTAIYRHMGGKDLSDQLDGAAFLADSFQIAPERIGIYGGSYGGFITLMAMFTEPGTFKCGAALRSVTDWAHYNHPYTSNILNTPVEDSIAYRRSSPIYHAEGLQDRLLILHGMVDDNVQFQDVVRLAQRLIELGKENWEMAVFPVEAHGFTEPSSWADEYKRIFKMFEEELK
jgi:acetyl esterase/lipase